MLQAFNLLLVKHSRKSLTIGLQHYCYTLLNSWAFCTGHSHKKLEDEVLFHSSFDAFGQHWTSSSISEHISIRSEWRICAKLSTSFIEQQRPALGQRVVWKRQITRFASSLVIHNDLYPLPPQPNGFSCQVPPSQVLLIIRTEVE